MYTTLDRQDAKRRILIGTVAIFAVISVGLFISTVPVIAGAAFALIWIIFGLREITVGYLIAIPLTAVLLVPADHIEGLNGPHQGFVVLGVTAILAGHAVLRGIGWRLLARDWDLLLLIGVLAGATIAHAAAGELRGILLWSATGLALVWWRGAESSGADGRSQACRALLAAGVIGALAAIGSQVAGFSLSRVIPGYVPDELSFSSILGLRSPGLSGHPLRFGTLTMLSALAALGWLVEGGRAEGSKVLAVLALCISLAGLALSGARGAWISFGVGALVLTLLQFRLQHRVKVRRMAAAIVAATVTLWVSGLLPVMNERLFGVASHPVSFGQRLQVLRAITNYWAHVPIFGGGFGGAEVLALSMGLRVPNLENEYIRFFLTGGFAAAGLFVVLGFRRLWAAVRNPSPGAPTASALVVGLMTNAATYNTFSWSAGGALLVAVMCACMPVHPSRADGAPSD